MKNFWSADELETLHRMLAENKTRVEIAEALGCARARVDGRIRFERKTPEQRLAEKKRHAEWFRHRKGVHSYQESTISLSRPTPELIEEAKLRAMAPRSLTAEFFGDPGIGFSALDRRNGA